MNNSIPVITVALIHFLFSFFSFFFFQQIHQRVPLYIGSTEEVEKVEKYLV